MDIKQAFFKAYSDIKNPNFDCINPRFKSKYSSLKEVDRVIRDACIPNGIMYRRKLTDKEPGVVLLSSFIEDASGARIDLSSFTIYQSENPQTFGTQLTYAKRQQAQVDWGISGEEDDDGNQAADKNEDAKSEKSTAMLKRIYQLKQECIEIGIKESGIDDYFRTAFGGKSYEQLSDGEMIVFGKYLANLKADKESLGA